MASIISLESRIRLLLGPKLFAAINIGSLIAAFAIALMIWQFISFEYSFENYNANAKQVFRINLYNTENGVFTGLSPATVSGLAYEVNETMPGVASVGRISHGVDGGIVSNPTKTVRNIETGMIYADPEVIKLLAVKLIYHAGDTLKSGTNSVLISESISLKYFGTVHSVGETLDFGFNNNSTEMTAYSVQGVFRDVPKNAIHRFDFIFPIGNKSQWDQNWDWSNVYTFVKFNHNTDPNIIENAFASIVKRNHKDDTGDRYMLESLSDIRLHALNGSGRMGTVRTFGIAAIIILILAWLNYVNMATARFVERTKEVGIRKLMGASRSQLILNFIGDAFFVNVLSIGLATVVFFSTWELVSQKIAASREIQIFSSWSDIATMVVLLVISTLLSGLYPAIFLSSFRPLQTIKGNVMSLNSRASVRKILVAAQLTISIVLVAAVYGVNQQLEFMKHHDLGISLDHTILINGPVMSDNTSIERFEPFKHEVLRLSGVKSITYATSYPGNEINWHRSDVTISTKKAFTFDSRVVAIGTEFLDFFSIPIIAGRNFHEGIDVDQKTMLLNEEAVKMFGFSTPEQALGEVISMGPRDFEIIGVIKNYHFRAVKYSLQPLLFMKGYPRAPKYAIKYEAGAIQQLLPKIEKIWNSSYGENVFVYEFLDKNFEREYKSEQLLSKIMSLLAFFALLIAFAGIFGLSVYAVNQKLKEIGIRKVLGASERKLILHLTRDYLRPLLVAAILGVIISFLLIDSWLQEYVYKMPMTPKLYALPICMVVFLIALSAGVQIIVAARRNPTDILRHE